MIHPRPLALFAILSAFLLSPAIAGPIISVSMPSGSAEPWMDTDYDRRCKITILSSQITTTMSNQVALIEMADLPATYHSNTRGDAFDTRFSSADKTTAIPHDLEYYDGANDIGWVWVFVDDLSSSADTDIFIYYGHSTATDGSSEDTWDGTGADYLGVWHMGDAGDSAQTSATGVAAIEADANNMESGDRIIGKIGYAMDFDGSNEYLSVPSGDASTYLRPDTTFTSHCWFRADDFTDGTIYGLSMNSTSSGLGNWLYGSQLRPSLGNGGNVWTNITEPTSGLSTGIWYHVITTWDGSSAKFYLDGVEVTDSPETETGSWSWASQPWYFGRRPSGDYYHGQIDETRIHDSVHVDPAWLHQNMDDPGSTYTISTEETQ